MSGNSDNPVNGLALLQRSAANGFTLIEIMVALAVFSLAALALLRLQGATLRNVVDIERRTVGQIVANNLAVDALTDPIAPPLGTNSGTVENGGQIWRWSRTASRTADVRIIRIEISVVDGFGRTGGGLSTARTIK